MTHSHKLDTSQVDDIVDGRMSKRMDKQISLGVRDSIAIMERTHKKDVIKRGSGPPVSGVWTSRTAEASRSFKRWWSTGDHHGAYGSELQRMKKLEEGGTIRPRRATYLAIPTAAAKSGVGGAVSPRDRHDLYFTLSKGGNPLLFQKGTNELMFVLRRSVTLPKRDTLGQAIKKSEKKRIKRMERAIEKGTARDGKG